MPPKNKARVNPDATEENLTWTDDEVELLLAVVRAYSSQKDYEGLEWESVKSKYEDIRKDFVTLYEQLDGFLHNLSLFKRERIASKIKDIRKKYKKAVKSGKKSGGGRTVATFYDACNEIWVDVLQLQARWRMVWTLQTLKSLMSLQVILDL